MVLRWTLMAAGTLALLLGVVGIFIPVLPTVPFLLLTAICWAKASPRMHEWLMNHKVLGPPIQKWNESKSIPLKIKILAISMILFSSSLSIFVLLGAVWLKVLVGAICAAVVVWLINIPTA